MLIGLREEAKKRRPYMSMQEGCNQQPVTAPVSTFSKMTDTTSLIGQAMHLGFGLVQQQHHNPQVVCFAQRHAKSPDGGFATAAALIM